MSPASLTVITYHLTAYAINICITKVAARCHNNVKKSQKYVCHKNIVSEIKPRDDKPLFTNKLATTSQYTAQQWCNKIQICKIQILNVHGSFDPSDVAHTVLPASDSQVVWDNCSLYLLPSSTEGICHAASQNCFREIPVQCFTTTTLIKSNYCIGQRQQISTTIWHISVSVWFTDMKYLAVTGSATHMMHEVNLLLILLTITSVSPA